MESPLLANGAEGMEDCPPVKGVGEGWKVLVGEWKKVFRVAGPMTFTLIFNYGISSSVQIFAGHLSNLELSAVSTSLSTVGFFASGLLTGMGSALDTVCGQAFGAGQVDMLSIYMQLSGIILVATAFLLSPIYTFATPILKLLGQDHEISVVAGKFTLHIIPQLFATAVGLPPQKFLQSQSKVIILAWIGLVALILHLGLLMLFIYVCGWGLNGVAAAYNISNWVTSVAQIIYVMGWCKGGRIWPSWPAFRGIWVFFRLALASAAMLCLQSWCSIVSSILIGHLSNAEIAVGSLSVCNNITLGVYMVLAGITAAASVRVSNELGSGRPRAAKYSIIVISLTAGIIGLLLSVIVLATRNQFPLIFTNNEELQRMVAKLAYLLAITILVTSFQSALSGAAIGGGLQVSVAYIIFCCNYIIGIPVGAVWGYILHWGMQGIWAGLLCGSVLYLVILSIMLWKTDWKEAAEASTTTRAQSRGGQDETKKLLE